MSSNMIVVGDKLVKEYKKKNGPCKRSDAKCHVAKEIADRRHHAKILRVFKLLFAGKLIKIKKQYDIHCFIRGRMKRYAITTGKKGEFLFFQVASQTLNELSWLIQVQEILVFSRVG